eukprot:XP_019925786.1 PREDICTED: peroxidase-like protein [Crassostrea gigas]
MHFVRSDIGPVPACDTGIRQQQNQRSSFIDGSAIYGFNTAKENSLREKRGGLLRVSSLHAYRPGVLPEGDDSQCENGHNGMLSRSPINHCFDAGDHRHTESPLLTVVHIMFLRRHNQIAEALQQATGILDDEVLFQETKRIVVAELNHITYNEYLPEIMAPEFIKYFGLKSKSKGHHNVYDPNVDPRAINSFAAAAYRFGHSFVQSVVGQDNGRSIMEDPLRNNFDNPTLINFPQNGGCEYVASWMANTGKSDMDRFVTSDLRNRLFDASPTGSPTTSPGATLSLDLVALNIQRGRDHGLPGYNVFRQWCGRPKAEHFGTWALGLVDHSEQSAAILQSIYRSNGKFGNLLTTHPPHDDNNFSRAPICDTDPVVFSSPELKAQRRSLKCEKFTDRHTDRQTDDGQNVIRIAHLRFQLRSKNVHCTAVNLYSTIHVMLYTACRSTLHQGFLSPSPVCVHLLSRTSVPLLPSTAYAAL